MDVKSIEWDRSNRGEGHRWFKSISAAEDVVGGTDGCSGKFGDGFFFKLHSLLNT